jgi:tetratricopeptide (TPR) repeat protein
VANLLARHFDEPAALRESLKWFQGAKDSQLSQQDLMTVAKIHEVLGDWSGARKGMLDLISQQKPDPRVYLAFIEMLIRNNQVSDAASWLDKLDAVQPAAGLLLRTRVLVKQGRNNEAIDLLKNILPKKPVPKDQVSALRTVALVMDQEGLNSTAEQLYREYMSYEPAAGALQLAAFLGRAGRLDDALDLLETRINENPLKSETRHMILDVVAEVLRGQPRRIQPRHLERVKGWFDRLLREDPESVPLLLQFADFQMAAGQEEKAEKLYRDVLNRSDIDSSQKAVTYNNLAFALASEHKNLPEALDLINRAGSELGFRSDVLDTRGMVYLAMTRYPEAVADFSDAVLVTNPSAVKLLHLAMAQDLSSDRPAARATLRRAKEAKLDSAALSKTEQAFLDLLVKDVGL